MKKMLLLFIALPLMLISGCGFLEPEVKEVTVYVYPDTDLLERYCIESEISKPPTKEKLVSLGSYEGISIFLSGELISATSTFGKCRNAANGVLTYIEKKKKEEVSPPP